jgi:hypothetical protein
MRCTDERPRPEPSLSGLVEKKGSKMRSRSSGGMPAPVSEMAMETAGLPSRVWTSSVEIRMEPLSPMA